MYRKSEVGILSGQILLGLILICSWEWAARRFGHEWTSLPSLIYERLLEWSLTVLPYNLLITTCEIVVGLAIGCLCGIFLGLALGYTSILGTILRPLIVGLYSIPLITLVPLLILWFGLGMMPKIVLVAASSFFLLFFNTFSGVQAIDRNLTVAMRLMGMNRSEEFRKVILPGSMSWIMSGIKIAVPYAFAAAVAGELLAASGGVGSLIARSATQFDMTGVYTSLLVLMIMGVVVSSVVSRFELTILKWRSRGE